MHVLDPFSRLSPDSIEETAERFINARGSAWSGQSFGAAGTWGPADVARARDPKPGKPQRTMSVDIPGAEWLGAYDRSWLSRDLVAGATVWAPSSFPPHLRTAASSGSIQSWDCRPFRPPSSCMAEIKTGAMGRRLPPVFATLDDAVAVFQQRSNGPSGDPTDRGALRSGTAGDSIHRVNHERPDCTASHASETRNLRRHIGATPWRSGKRIRCRGWRGSLRRRWRRGAFRGRPR